MFLPPKPVPILDPMVEFWHDYNLLRADLQEYIEAEIKTKLELQKKLSASK
jgi:hypothetical protein